MTDATALVVAADEERLGLRRADCVALERHRSDRRRGAKLRRRRDVRGVQKRSSPACTARYSSRMRSPTCSSTSLATRSARSACSTSAATSPTGSARRSSTRRSPSRTTHSIRVACRRRSTSKGRPNGASNSWRQASPVTSSGIERGRHRPGAERGVHRPRSACRATRLGPASVGAVRAAGGDAESVEELAELVGDGLYITRLHYLGVVHPREGIITGMTRDGTFRIRDGKIAEPLVNLRFTVAVPDLLRDVVELTNKAYARELAELLRRAVPLRSPGTRPRDRSASRSRASARSPGFNRRVVHVSQHVLAPTLQSRRDEASVDDPRDWDGSRRSPEPFVDQLEIATLLCRAQCAQQRSARLQPVVQDELRRNRLLLRIDGEHAFHFRSGRECGSELGTKPTSRHCA